MPTLFLLFAMQALSTVIDSYPSASPDGNHVLFQSNRTGHWQLFFADRHGNGLRQLTSLDGDCQTAKWSPDGRQILFSYTTGERERFAIVNADGSNFREITNGAEDDEHPNWCPDGQCIVFNSARTSPDKTVEWSKRYHEIFTMKLDGSDVHQITRCRTVCTYPSFSPDGKRIAYRKVIDGPAFQWDLTPSTRNSEVFIANADGSGEINISNSAAFDGWPAWSPDGRWLAFTSNRSGPANVGQIFVADMTDHSIRQITSGPWSHAQPAWSRDGATIFAYELQENDGPEFGRIVAIDVSSLPQGNQPPSAAAP